MRDVYKRQDERLASCLAQMKKEMAEGVAKKDADLQAKIEAL